MLVHHKNLDDFIAELRDCQTTVADKIVRWQSGKLAKDHDEIEFEVAVFGTAIVGRDDADYLLEYAESVGIDRNAYGDISTAGSERAKALRKKLQEHCDDMGLRLLPGKLELF